MRSRSVSLTGATGFVGWHVAEALRNDGWAVRAIVRPGPAKPVPQGVEAVRAPLESAALRRVIEGSDLVVHCAGLIRAPSDEAFASVNVEGTRAVVEAVNQRGVRLVLMSSQAAGGAGTREHPRRETDPPRPVNAYGRSKLAGEDVVRAHATAPWTILRPCAVYGPRDRGFLPIFRLASRGLFFLPTRASMAFTLIDVSDLARAVVLAATADGAVGATLSIGHPEPQTAEDILRAAAAAFRRPYRPRPIPAFAVRAAAAVGDQAWKFGLQFAIDHGRLAELRAEGFVCAVDRARVALGFSACTPLAEGLARAASWYLQQGWL